MNELVLKRINNAIEQFDKKPINTKYLTTFMFYKDNLVTKKDIEKYLMARKYIKISDNYMFYFEDLIEYCESNKIEHINKLKRYMFSDFGVPYISLTNDDLSLILNNKEMQKHYSDIIYTSEENSDRKIIVKSHNCSYTVRNREDLIRFGLTNTYITYDLLKHYCILFPEESQFEIRYLLDDRDIKITSGKLIFEAYPIKQYDKVAESEVRVSYDCESEESDFIDIGISYNEKSSRFLMELCFLNPSDIKYFLMQLAMDNKIIFSKEDFLSKYSYIECEKMYYSGIIADKGSKIIIKPVAWIIINQIKRDRFLQHHTNKYPNDIQSYYSNEHFFNKYNKQIKQLLLENKEISMLSKLLKAANASNKFSIRDIMYYCIENNIQDQFISIFLGNRPTNGIKPLKDNSDVCFCCNRLDECTGKKIMDKGNSYISDMLLKYRNIYSKECLSRIKQSREINILAEKPIYLKFLVSYNMTVKIKSLLKQFRLLEEDPVLYKDNGKYCPRKDIWRINT